MISCQVGINKITMELPTIPIASKRILIVENNPQVREELTRIMEIEGYYVQQVGDGTAGLKLMVHWQPNLIISDMNVPNMNGMEFCKSVRNNPPWVAIPFIFLTSHADPEDIQRGRELGVDDYIIKPIDPNNLVKIVNARLLRAAELQIALIDQAYLDTINVLANTIESRDPYTHGHVDRVVHYSKVLANKLNWPLENMRMLEFGSRLHDIGKIFISDEILNKSVGLTPEEWNLVKQHPQKGAKILENITHLANAVPYVLYHHERWDGSGYPHHLSKREIPIEGRLLAITDVFDALTTDRPYHPRRKRQEVFDYLLSNAGILFDPDLVPIYIEAMKEDELQQKTTQPI